MSKFTNRTLAGLALIGAFGLGTVTSAWADQPNMHAALAHLTEARASLVRADNDKGGHRAAAIRLTDQAIARTRLGIRFDRRN